MDTPSKGNFGHHRKIMPFEPGAEIDVEALRRHAREKAAALNSHVLGYGETAEREWAAAGVPAPDLPAMRKYRLERIRAELKRRGYAGVLLYDPVNIRYATDSTNMQLWVARNSIYKARGYCFKTQRAISYFGNAGCIYQNEGDIPFSAAERAQIAQFRSQEQAMGCQ